MSDFKVIDEYPFSFYDHHFTVALGNDRKLYVPIPLMCRALHVDPDGQIQRIQRDEVIQDALKTVRFERYPHGEEGIRARSVNALRLDRLPYWLGTIDASRIRKQEVKQQIVTFKREFADVAWAAFRTEILPGDVLAEFDAQEPPEQQAYYKAMDDASVLRRNLKEQTRKLSKMEERVSSLEARFEGTDFINSQQAKQYMDMVNIVAAVMKRKGTSAPHAKIHGEIKKVFEIPSYSLIPEKDFPAVQKYLAQLFQRVTVPGTPLPTVFRNPNQRRML